MSRLVKAVYFLIFSTTTLLGVDPAVVETVWAHVDVPLQTDPASVFWSAAQPTYLEKDRHGNSALSFRTEVRTRWTTTSLYFLFICPYDQLYLKSSPITTQETNELWKWDVAEVFISSDFSDSKRYQEFEVSPQGEWIGLDIDLNQPHHESGWTWNSGFEASARIDAASHRWYAAMRIPLSAIDKRPLAAGNEFRLNLFLSEGPPSSHHAVTWQPPMSDTFHVPERFGLLKLVPEKR
jgi:hypothetical protein